jgi:hypothetical protein
VGGGRPFRFGRAQAGGRGFGFGWRRDWGRRWDLGGAPLPDVAPAVPPVASPPLWDDLAQKIDQIAGELRWLKEAVAKQQAEGGQEAE